MRHTPRARGLSAVVRLLGLASCLASCLLTLASCGGSGGGGDGGGPTGAPSITSFTASTWLVQAGNSVDLTAVFDGADARILPGDIPVASGVPVSVLPAADTTYSLVVIGEDGTLATAAVAVTVVDFLLDVTSDDDGGPGTLREAMEIAAAAPVLRTAVTFSLGLPATITLESDLPNVVGWLRIVGPGGTADLTVHGANEHRILFVDGGHAIVSDVTLRNGHARGGKGGDASVYGGGGGGGSGGLGGAAFVNGGILSCSRVLFLENEATGGTGGIGKPIPAAPPYGVAAGGGGGGCGSDGVTSNVGGAGGDGGAFGGEGGIGGLPGNGIEAGDGGEGAGGGGTEWSAVAGNGGFGGGGGASGPSQLVGATGGAGGFGGGGGGAATAGSGGPHGGTGGVGSAPGGGGGAGLGGAVFARLGAVYLTDCHFESNSASAGTDGGGGAAPGEGKGGAIYVMPTAVVYASGTSFTSNMADDAAGTPGDTDDVFGVLD